MATTYHVGIDVRGALLNWSDREFRGVFLRVNGHPMSVYESKMALMNEISKNHKVIPCSPCDNWDYQKGCQGHPVEEPT